MKCVKNLKLNKVERVRDEIADKRVKSGEWHYTTKSVWRTWLKEQK